jgi:hypothetical protein
VGLDGDDQPPVLANDLAGSLEFDGVHELAQSRPRGWGSVRMAASSGPIDHGRMPTARQKTCETKAEGEDRSRSYS